ncbi:hypothetical protein AB4516_00820 [Vibrio sp. 10N.222.54.F12]|uniref:hypothetical protein n=1 Tax=Vibrio TaxID=662 RepID=UPI000C815B48|nr:hypothetical protein [Vibrio tasmaniensis]PML17684.1 hypothetical protein BCT83_08310 [Vibrio tasmaniensis]
MGIVNNQNSPSQAKNHLMDKLIGSLGDTDGLTYFCYLASQYGFSTAGRWSSLQNIIACDIESTDQGKIQCTVDRLETAIDRFICQSDHTYQIVELSKKDATNIRKKIVPLGGTPRTSEAYKLYPGKFKFVDGQSYPQGFSLCKVTDLGDGYAMIYSSVKVKHSYKGFDDYSQTFHNVFIPHTKDRVEYRVSSAAGKRFLNEELKELQKSFINDIAIRHSGVDAEPVNVFKAIKNLFNDVNAGRMSWGRIATFTERPYLSSSASSDPGHCGRSELAIHKKSKNGNDYHPWQIVIQFKYSPSEDEEMQVEFLPHRFDWKEERCFSFNVKEPKNSMELTKTINDIIFRS